MTDLHVHNPSGATAQVAAVFQPVGGNQPYRTSLDVAPGATVNLQDAVQELFGLGNAIGSIVLQTDSNGEDTLRVNARIFVGGENGTKGMAITSSPTASSAAASSTFVTGLVATGAFRSNLGAINTTDSLQIFKIVLWSPSGSVLYVSPAIRLSPGVPMQWSTLTLFPRANGAGLLAEFRPEEQTKAPLAYGTLVDNASGDSTFHPAMAPVAKLYLPAIGHISGVGGVFLTDISISNTTNLAVDVQATFLEHDDSNANPATVALTLDPHETLRVADALGSLFGVTNSYGALRLQTSDGSSSLVSTARIYTNALTSGGTVGQQINAITDQDLRTAGSLLGLQQNAAFRSNVAFFNPNDFARSVTLVLQDANGRTLANRTLSIPPSSYVQRSLPILFPGTAFPRDAIMTVSFQTLSATGVFAFASVIDNNTDDPSFFPSVP